MKLYQPKRHESAHFFYGAIIAALTLWAGPHWAMFAVLGAAMGKEAIDPYIGGTRDPLDIVWTLAGGIAVTWWPMVQGVL